MRNGFKVFDADAHVVEPKNLWERFLEPRYKGRVVYHVIEELGDDRILFETDYPHPDSKYPRAVQTFLEQERVCEASKRRILWDNALDFYRFPESYLPAEFEEAAPGG